MESESGPGRSVVRRGLTGALGIALVALPLTLSAAPTASAAPSVVVGDDAIYLVTLDGPGLSGYRGFLPRAISQLRMLGQQDTALGLVGDPTPVARWTTALNGFAVRLTRAEAHTLAAEPSVSLVERNAVRKLAGRTSTRAGLAATGPHRGGAGVVIGMVDSGIHPESPLFADVPSLRSVPQRFVGDCTTGQDWDADTCNRKIVGARWFVDGFGRDHLRTASSLSARDDDGHGTQMSSIAAGNPGITVRVEHQRLGNYGGAAPQARLAVYKACWTAPDPHDDGCATADLVSAIDAATRDGVDVLNLSVGGPDGFDTVERALLGAAEADIVVVAAAGNGGQRSYAAHASPWVTTVGASTGVARRGRVELSSGPTLTGAMSATRAAGPARLVVGARVAAPGTTREAARVCTPGSLDAARVSGAIVLCERGEVGRIDKSAAVRRADGVGMVLMNVTPGSLDADLHSVPTVHVDRTDGRVLKRWVARHPGGRVTLSPLGVEHQRARVPVWSNGGDPSGAVLKPDVVAPSVGILGAIPPDVRGARWDFVSGTSAGTAFTSGTAAVLLRRHGWSAPSVRSALATTASPLGGSVLRSGAGRVRPGRAADPGLVYAVPVEDYRAWLDGVLPNDLNTPSLVLTEGDATAQRTVTNVGRRTLYFSSRATGFSRHSVTVTPAAIRLDPGESTTWTVRVDSRAGAQPGDDGFITWRGANGTRTRIPVLLTR
ncbi:MAG: vpr 1 [Nocardioides sp.]|nr:vpr 1 [Nocardioides sp.]